MGVFNFFKRKKMGTTNMTNIIKMFPETTDVFANRIEEHSKYLFPLFSIDLCIINPEWKGTVHMLEFNEDPYNRETISSFNEYCSDCMIGFDIIDGKYSFKSDFNYFALSKDWIEYFEKTKEEYQTTKNYYIENHKLPDYIGEPGKIYEQIGGNPEWIQGDATPLDPDGNRMTFITRIYSSNYSISGGKDIYLFYSDKFKIAVILYQTT